MESTGRACKDPRTGHTEEAVVTAGTKARGTEAELTVAEAEGLRGDRSRHRLREGREEKVCLKNEEYTSHLDYGGMVRHNAPL